MKITCFVKRKNDIVIENMESVLQSRSSRSTSNFISNAWDERNIEILLRDYPKVQRKRMRVIDLARKLGKTYDSVQNKARRMGLT